MVTIGFHRVRGPASFNRHRNGPIILVAGKIAIYRISPIEACSRVDEAPRIDGNYCHLGNEVVHGGVFILPDGLHAIVILYGDLHKWF